MVHPGRVERQFDVFAAELAAGLRVDGGLVLGIDVIPVVRAGTAPEMVVRRRDRSMAVWAFQSPVFVFSVDRQLRHWHSTLNVGGK